MLSALPKGTLDVLVGAIVAALQIQIDFRTKMTSDIVLITETNEN